MLVKVEVLREVGFLDEMYFLGVEDIDYSYQVLCSGWKLVVCYDAKVWHKVGCSRGIGNAPLDWYYNTRNRLYFGLCKIDSLSIRLRFITYFVAGQLVNLIKLPLKGKLTLLRASLVGIRDYIEGRLGEAPSGLL